MAANHPRQRRLAALLLTAFAVPAAPAIAQTTQLNEILVTAQREDAPSRTGTTTVIGSAELNKRNATDMANMARYEPLISVPAAGIGSGNIWDGAGNTGFNIRGVEGNRVSLDLDGISLPDAAPKPDGNTLNSFGVGRDYFDPEIFREVRIGSGTSAAGAGTPGLGGSVSFVTKSPEDYLSATRNSYAEYKFGYTSGDKARMHALTGAAGFGALQALAVLVHRDGQQLDSKGSAVLNPDDWSSDALLGKFSWAPVAGHKLGFTVDAFKSGHDREIKNKQLSLYPEGSQQASTTRRTRVSLDHGYTAAAGLLFDSIDTRLYVQDAKVEDNTHAPYITGGRPYTRDISTGLYNKSVGIASDAGKQLNAATLLNYGFTLEDLETRRPWKEDRLVVGTTTHQLTQKNRMADMDTLKFAAYARGDIAFALAGHNATLTPGLRFEHRKLSPKNLENYLIAVPSAAKELKDDSDSYLAPSLGLSVELTPSFNAYASFKRGARMPSGADRTSTYDSFSYTGAGQGYGVLGNAKLEKETSNAVELGVKGEPRKGVQFSASAFHTAYRNFIEYVAQPADPVNYPTLSQGLFRPENVARAGIWGVEMSSRFDLGQWSAPLQGASVAVAAGGSRGTTTNDRTGKKGDLATVLPYKGSATLAWDDPGQRGGVSLTTVHARAKQAKPDVVSGATTVLFAVPASTVVDLAAYFNLGKNAVISAGAYNLGDKKYWDYASARTLAAGTTATALADIERQVKTGRNYAVTFKLMY
ncbi:TonB-dependent receptor domain-containing protein [Pseudoduganella aquatica]|uniref:TonB-dependent receptor domain-containing protein n=1 Tax=Pseudoduganella aquatica TaxID=2660641 RepID=UPI001E3BBFD5|nr:TonB-dependent receptor [Pseudoduganella aquatica]